MFIYQEKLIHKIQTLGMLAIGETVTRLMFQKMDLVLPHLVFFLMVMIYLAGYTTGTLFTYDIGCKWRNGNLHELSSSVSETDQTWLYDIAVANDVKITKFGFYYPVIYDYNDPLYYNSPIFPCYYRNGQRVNLEDADWQLGEATGVFID